MKTVIKPWGKTNVKYNKMFTEEENKGFKV
jgi:hypothetical protein